MIGVALAVVLAAEPIAPFGYEPVNPYARARTPLAVLAVPRGDAPQVTASFDLANTVEAEGLDRAMRLDAELYLWRAELWWPLTRDFWLYGRLAVGAAGGGVLDGAIDAWHDLLFSGHAHFNDRDYMPVDRFSDRVELPGARVQGEPGASFSEVKLGWAWRPRGPGMLALTLSLPTATTPQRGLRAPALAGWGRLRLEPWRWVSLELAGGVGAAATEGPLAAYQSVFFAAGAVDLALRPTENHAFFAQLWVHSPYYRGTNAVVLDGPDLSLRLGYRGRVAGLFELEGGITEDLADGSAVDVIFHFALRR